MAAILSGPQCVIPSLTILTIRHGNHEVNQEGSEEEKAPASHRQQHQTVRNTQMYSRACLKHLTFTFYITSNWHWIQKNVGYLQSIEYRQSYSVEDKQGEFRMWIDHHILGTDLIGSFKQTRQGAEGVPGQVWFISRLDQLTH